jgi:hypothetical protein
VPYISGGNVIDPAELICEERTFTQVTNSGGKYTATVTIPANSWIIDIKVYGQVVWDSATSAILKVGDASVADGWYTGVRLHTTDLLINEVLSFDSAGGVGGAYIDASTGLRNTMWSASERVLTAEVTEITTAGASAGRTRMLVIYSTTSSAGAATFA